MRKKRKADIITLGPLVGGEEPFNKTLGGAVPGVWGVKRRRVVK